MQVLIGRAVQQRRQQLHQDQNQQQLGLVQKEG
jgi:hypothetical protein